MNIEHWLPVKGYEGIYEVSDIGRIREGFKGSKKKSVKTFIGREGYIIAVLVKCGVKSQQRIHRLIYESFVGDIKGVIDHIDGIKTNNMLINLEDVTQQENCIRYHSSIKGIGR